MWILFLFSIISCLCHEVNSYLTPRWSHDFLVLPKTFPFQSTWSSSARLIFLDLPFTYLFSALNSTMIPCILIIKSNFDCVVLHVLYQITVFTYATWVFLIFFMNSYFMMASLNIRLCTAWLILGVRRNITEFTFRTLLSRTLNHKFIRISFHTYKIEIKKISFLFAIVVVKLQWVIIC